jgi:hypothetical protein
MRLGQQGVKRHEKIEVDRGEIHHVNSRDSINRLDEFMPARHTRRMAARLTVLAACVLLAQTHAQPRPAGPSQHIDMTQLRSRHLFTITIKLHPIEEIGNTPAGTRRVFPVAGGDFAGERLRGTILPVAGSDLLLTRADGSSQQDVRMILRTDDGALIVMTYRGVRHAPPEVNARLARGEPVAASEYYLRTAPFFETSSPTYAWLNTIVSVGVGDRRPNDVVYQVFEIL